MNQLLFPGLAAAAGLLMGILYFGGLWATVVRLQSVPNPGFYLLASLILRFGCCLAGFAAISYYSGWLALVFAMAGFTLARLLVIREFQKRGLQQGYRQ
jgi:F1F0 ATPase subunit 2